MDVDLENPRDDISPILVYSEDRLQYDNALFS